MMEKLCDTTLLRAMLRFHRKSFKRHLSFDQSVRLKKIGNSDFNLLHVETLEELFKAVAPAHHPAPAGGTDLKYSEISFI